jgi:hypothetical protein
MSLLGTIEIKLKAGTIIRGIALLDENHKQVAAVGLRPIKPADGDTIQVEILSSAD